MIVVPLLAFILLNVVSPSVLFGSIATVTYNLLSNDCDILTRNPEEGVAVNRAQLTFYHFICVFIVQ